MPAIKDSGSTLAETVQKLKEKMDALNKRIQRLETDNLTLERAVAKRQSRIDALEKELRSFRKNEDLVGRLSGSRR